MAGIILLLAFPLLLMNYFGLICAVVWLIIIGDYSILITAFITSMLAAFGLSLAMLPSIIFALPGVYLFKIGGPAKVLGWPLLIAAGAWNYIAMGCWTLYVFYYATIGHGDNLLPYLLLAYSVATGPFAYMASKEPAGNSGASLAVATNQIASLALLVLIFFTNLVIVDIFFLFWAIMLIGLISALSTGLISQMAEGNNSAE